MIKLLAVSDMTVRGVTVSRLDSLERLAENGHEIAVRTRHKFPKKWDVDWCDCIFFLRAIDADDLSFLKEAKIEGKKIWVDTDDDLLNVPSDHSGYFSMRDPELHVVYKRIHQIADHVTFSTQLLADSGLAKNTSVIPCSYPDEVIERLTKPGVNAKTVLWRGTQTHERSLHEFAPAIVQVMQAHPDWRIEFIGSSNPWRITDHIPNWYVSGFFDVVDMLQKIHELRASVHIVPRANDLFTRSRSSVSYVEAACSGATTIAPKWVEWELPGTLNYDSIESFAALLEQAIVEAGSDAHKKRWADSVEYIKANRVWSATNKQHAKVLKEIMGGK